MGIVASSNTKSRFGICLTLDAFGTLYHPKKPIAAQYVDVARRCGLRTTIPVPKLEASFRKAFKIQSARYPNYGKSQGMSVESWWEEVVHGAFRPLCYGQTLPASLASTLFHHFSSWHAYSLYPDVLPFFKIMRELRQRYSDPSGPIIVTGIITNSDNRARTILQSLGLQVGTDWQGLSQSEALTSTWEAAKERQKEEWQHGRKIEKTPLSGKRLHSYKSTDDIDFLATSYATGYEKPNSKIFFEAEMLAARLRMSRLEQMVSDEFLVGAPRNFFKAAGISYAGRRISHIHVGDDLEKDYHGAKDAFWQALHLCRDDKTGVLKDYQIPDLLELAKFIRVMADTNFSHTATTAK